MQSEGAAVTTCQICGRAIKAKSGLIAHHGYTRPGHGWQTKSCFGARWRSYEVACDALPKAIEGLAAYIASTQASLAKWIADPPPGITVPPRGSFKAYQSPTVSVLRPVGFDAEHTRPDYCSDSYVTLYRARRYSLESDIKHATADLSRLEKRLSDWHPVALAV